MAMHRVALVLSALLLAALLSGCASRAPQETPTPAPVALTITGLVDRPQTWTVDQIKEMDKASAMALCSDSGKERDYTGPLVNGLLDAARPKPEAAEVIFYGEYDVTGQATLAEVRTAADGIVAVTGSGKLRVILPGLPGTAQVTGLTRIELR